MTELKKVAISIRKVIFAVNASENKVALIRRFVLDLDTFFALFLFTAFEKIAGQMLRTEMVYSSELLLKGFTVLARVSHYINLCVYYGCGDDVAPIVVVGAVLIPTVYALFALKEYAYFRNELC